MGILSDERIIHASGAEVNRLDKELTNHSQSAPAVHRLFTEPPLFPIDNRLLCVCFGLGASVEDAQDLLRQARHAPLYTRDRRDAIILYGLSHSMTLFQINDKLFTEKLDTLC